METVRRAGEAHPHSIAVSTNAIPSGFIHGVMGAPPNDLITFAKAKLIDNGAQTLHWLVLASVPV
jgi:hypothetical protein